MTRRGLLLLFLGLLACPALAQPGPGLFGDRRWRAPIANAGALPVSASLGEVRLTLDDGALYFWDGDSWEAAGAPGAGEANTASTLGGGLAVYDSKLGIDLRFNSLAAADFDLALNVITIDDTKWAKDSELPVDTNAGTVCAGTTTYLDGEGLCDDLALVYSVLAHDHALSALSGAVTDDQVPNNITVDFAATAGGAPPTGAAGGDLGGLYPDPTVDDDGHAHTAATLPAASTTAAGLVELATDGEAVLGLAVQGNDFRLSDSRAPTVHASSHGDGGADEVSVAALSGQLADAQKVTVRKNTGADVGTRSRLNLIEGAGVTLTVVDDGAGGEVDVTVAASGSGIGGSTGATDNMALRSDGTGGATLQASGLQIDDNAAAWVAGIASAVNGVKLTPSATGGGVAVSSYGADADVQLTVEAKGNSRLLFRSNGIDRLWINSSGLVQPNGAGFRLSLSGASATGPNIMPAESDPNTGLGAAGPDQLSMIAGGAEGVRVEPAITTLAALLRLTPQAAPPACTAGLAGALYHDTAPALCWCSGSAWVEIAPTAGGSSCT